MSAATLERPVERTSEKNDSRERNRQRAPETPARSTSGDTPASAPKTNYNLDSMSLTPPTGGYTPPPPPAPGVTAEQVAAREAQLAEARASLDGAANAKGAMDAFKNAPPTLKAQASGELGTRFTGAMGKETQTLQSETPALTAELNAGGPPPIPTAVDTTPPAVNLEPVAPSPAPDADTLNPPIPLQTQTINLNPNVVKLISRPAPDANRQQDISKTLDKVSTSAPPDLEASPGPPPQIQLEGENDPQRMRDQTDEGARIAGEQLEKERTALAAVPGVERVPLPEVKQTESIEPLVAPTVQEEAAPQGAQKYLAMNAPAEIQTAFDEIANAPMQQSLAEAQAQIDQATLERDQNYQGEVQKAQTENDRLNQDAYNQQQAQIKDTQKQIETERQSTSDQQQAAVEDVKKQGADRQAADQKQIDERVALEQKKIDDEHKRAEAEAQAEVRKAEEEAERKRKQAEYDSEHQSWWEKAVDFVADLFDALVDAINAVFDFVRSVVNKIIDAVRSVVNAIIDAVASVVKGLIKAFGEFLKFVVDNTIGKVFPELAQKFNEYIDKAVDAATSAIDAVADGLKKAVNAVLDVLQAGVNLVMNVFQGVVNAGLAVVRLAITGDWDHFVVQMVESACRVAGITPEQLYSYVGRAEGTLQTLVDDPGAFVGHLVDAFTTGVSLFADHFLTHLQAGVISWLTGRIGGAGITLPQNFDLLGVISLVAQVVGLTWDALRQRIGLIVGERGVQAMEYVAGVVQTLIEGGWSALWERIQSDLTNLRDMALEQLKGYLEEAIIRAALTRLAMVFNPAGALVALILLIYNLYTFIRDQMARLAAIATTLANSIVDIASGNIEAAAKQVEGVLASLLPLAIDLLARFLGLGDVTERVRAILTNFQKTINNAIDSLIKRIMGAFKGDKGAAPGAPNAAQPPLVASADGATSRIGKDIPIVLPGGETHHFFIETHLRDAELVVQSVRQTVPQYLALWRSRLGQLPDDAARTNAQNLINQLDAGDNTLESHAEAALRVAAPGAAPPTPAAAPAALASEQQSIASLLKQLFILFRETDKDDETRLARLLTTRYQAQLNEGDPAAQGDVFSAVMARPRAYYDYGLNAWDKVKADVGTRSEFVQHPLEVSHKFGTSMRGALRKPVQSLFEERQKADPAAEMPADVDTVINSRIALIQSASPPFTQSLQKVREQIFDKSKRQIALQTLIGEYRVSIQSYKAEGEEHTRYQPIYLAGFDDKSFPTIKYTYQGADVPQFTVTLDASKEVTKISSSNLRYKHAAAALLGAVAGRGVTQRSPNYEENFFLNAAHLIADEFTGSGYKQAHNIVTTSAYYNQITMRDAERRITTFIQAISQLHSPNDPDTITFNMDVQVSYGNPSLTADILKRAQSVVVSKVPKNERAAFEQDWNSRVSQLINASANIRRVMGVAYSVTVLVNDANVPNNALPITLGPDIYLGMDDDWLRALMK